MSTVISDRLLSRNEAAEFLGVASQTLACWKSTGRYALPVVMVGTRAKYRVSDLEAFIAANRTTGTEGK